MKKIAIYAAAALILLGGRVGATPEAPTINSNGAGIVSVTGTLGTENANEWVSLTVYKTASGTAGISAGTVGSLNWYDQTKTDANGEYTFSFNMTGERATSYSFSVTTDEISVPVKEFVYYPSSEDTVIQTAIDNAKTAGDATAMDGVISTYKDYLQLDMTDYSALGAGGALPTADQLSVCANIIESDISDIKKFKQAFEDCSRVKVLNKETDAVSYEADMLAFITADAATAAGYFADYIQTEKSAIIADMMGDDTFKKKADLVSYFNEKVLPKEANKAKLWPEMQELVLSMALEYDVDLTGYNALSNPYGNNQSKALQLMIGATYTSCEQIISAFNTAVATTPVPIRKVNGGGGSSGGGGGSSVIEIPTPVVPQEPFPDISQVSWAKDSIKRLFTKGIISGDEKGNFNPHANVTRAQYIKMIVTAMDMHFGGQISEFDDVKTDAWHHNYIVVAKEAGLVSGITDNAFGPDLPITRQDAATMIKRAADFKNISLTAERNVDISDEREIADYAKEAVEALYACEILNGVGDGRFAPKDNMTRAQAAVIISNFLDRLEGLN